MIDGLLSTAALSAVLAFVFVGIVRQLAVRHGVLDHPTERSSHSAPTPRGGGLGLLIAGLGLWAWRASQPVAWTALVPLLGAASVAFIGWLDDRRGLPVRTRLVVHVLAAIGVGAIAAAHAPSALVAGLLLVVWSGWAVTTINLVNFMDGINGLVASQIAIFAVSLALFPGPAETSQSTAFYAVAIGAACLGFLPWNFPRARIFLGDVGSGGLGYLVPVLALMATGSGSTDVVRAHLPLLPLLGDAVWTLIRRWLNGERITQAHRSHLYQRLANGGMGHTAVTILYAIIAAFGALVAHASAGARAPLWISGYVVLTVAAGLVLHRRVSGAARPLA